MGSSSSKKPQIVEEIENKIRNSPEEISDHSNYNILFGQSYGKKVVFGYIHLLNNEYKLNIPLEIYKVCFSFYQRNSFEWTINMNKKHNGSQYKSNTQISLLNTDIKIDICFRFSIISKHFCALLTEMNTRSSIPCSNLLKLYYHITCKELNYDQKGIADYSMVCDRNSVWSKVPITHSITFDFYYKIIPLYPLQRKISTLKMHPLRMKRPFTWTFDKKLMNAILNNVYIHFYSNNFYNEGCYCLRVKNQSWKKQDTDDGVIKLEFGLKILSNPLEYNTSLYGGILSIFTCDKHVIHRKLSDKKTTVKMRKEVVIKSVDFVFQFVL